MTNESKMLTMLETLTEDVGSMKQDVSDLKQDNSSLKADNLSFKEIHDGIFTELGRIRESLARMENDQGRKINVLFDAYMSSKEENAETRQRVSVLEKRADNVDLRIMALETAEA
jgi:FtsZ-binding cell division protein ZapB